MRPSIPALCAVIVAGGLSAAEVGDYQSCVALATIDPERALIEAERWRQRSGAPGALHCEAIALSEIGATRTAAEKLSSLALVAGLEDAERSEVLLQAGRLWLEIGAEDSARRAFDGAVSVKPTASALVERASFRVRSGDWSGARADLDEALSQNPDSEVALSLRATARRKLGDVKGAEGDALKALEIRPVSAAAWLELGQAQRAQGQTDAARRSWLKAIDVAPGGPAASLARGALQDLDGG